MAGIDWLIVGKSLGHIPGGIKFDIAEIGGGSATTLGAIAFALKYSYGQFNRLRHHGVVVIR